MTSLHFSNCVYKSENKTDRKGKRNGVGAGEFLKLSLQVHVICGSSRLWLK